MPSLEHARLDWDAFGQPLSSRFSDVYFSRDNGLQESQYVFLTQNHLQERFSKLADTQTFRVGETGFGTGLNFLCTWQLFTQAARPSARLHFVSTEKFPLTANDLHKALALWPALQHLSEPFLAQYKAIHPGRQDLVFDNGRITLTLLVGDAGEMLDDYNECMDAWFLDGFAPERNPEMWSDQLFSALARLSGLHTTLSTFTSAGLVKRGLRAHGFAVKRVKGFGPKWHLLAGHYCGIMDTQPSPAS